MKPSLLISRGLFKWRAELEAQRSKHKACACYRVQDDHLFPGLCTGTLLCPEDNTLFIVFASNSASDESMNTCGALLNQSDVFFARGIPTAKAIFRSIINHLVKSLP